MKSIADSIRLAVALLVASGASVFGQCFTPTNPIVSAPSASLLRTQGEMLYSPARVAADAAGKIYVTDPREGRVIVYDAFGRLTSTQGNLQSPLGIAIDHSNRIYVGEQKAGSVSVFDGEWNLLGQLGAGNGEFLSPNHIAADPTTNGTVYVSDSFANEIKVYHEGLLVRRFGTYGVEAGQFDFAAGVFVSTNREVFVVDQNNDRVQVFTSDGAFLRCFSLATSKSKGMFGPTRSGKGQAIAGDAAGRIYVTDVFQGFVKVFDMQGVFLRTIGSMGEGPGQFRMPGGVAIDPLNRLIVSSANNSRVDVFGLDSFIQLTTTPPTRLFGVGSNLTFSVIVNGEGPFACEWRKDGVPLADGGSVSGATTATLNISGIDLADAGAYSIAVTGPSGTFVSGNSTISVMAPPEILVAPADQEVIRGTAARLQVVATGHSLSYQWLLDGKVLPGATGSTLELPAVKPHDVGEYTVVLRNAVGSVTSLPARIVLLDDPKPVMVDVLSPKPRALFTNIVELGVSGVAADDLGIAAVFCSVNDGEEIAATLASAGTVTNWTAVLPIQPGPNLVAIRAVDLLGNSAHDSTTIYNRIRSPFSLSVNGVGQVVPASTALGAPTNGAALLVGYAYKLTAKVGAGTNWVLTNWTASVNGGPTFVIETTSPTLTFTMQSNLSVTANFIPNPMMAVAGVYNGLFFEPDQVRHHSAGYISFRVTPRFGASGKLLVDGNAVPFSAKVSIDGTIEARASRQRFEKNDLRLNLALDVANGSDGAIGTVTDSVAGWSATLVADRYIWNTNRPAAQYAGRYTVAIPGFANPADGPTGAGGMSLVVNSIGGLTASGVLADRTSISRVTVLSKAGDWPLFLPLYPVKRVLLNGSTNTETTGEVIGWLKFETNTPAVSTNLAPLGTVSWLRPPSLGTNYPAGFTNETDVLSSRWVYSNGTPVIAMTNGMATIDGGGLSAPFQASLTLSTNNTLLVPWTAPNRFRAKLTLTTGRLSGSFIHPAHGTSVGWSGVLLQDFGIGVGSFAGPANGGSVVIEPVDNR